MDFFDVLDKRHSMRCFLPKKVAEKDLQKILLAANSAPSAGDLQAFKIFVAKKSGTRAAIAKAVGQEFVCEAPLVLVFFADKAQSAAKYGKRGEELYCVQDATIACAYAQLAATALGLAACWVGSFDSREVKKVCGTQFSHPAIVPVAILPVGFASAEFFSTSRKALSEIAVEEKN